LLLAVATTAAVPLHPFRSPSWLRLRAGLPSVRGVRHPRVRPPPGGTGVLRGVDPAPSRCGPPRPGRGHLPPPRQETNTRRASDVVTCTEVTCPSDTPDGLHAPGLRFGDKRVMAVMAAIVGFTHLLSGFDNRTITARTATLLDQPYTARQATLGCP